MRRREKNKPMRKVRDLEMDGRQPPGRPRKTWKKTVEKDIRLVGVREEDALDRGKWRALTKHQASAQGSRRR